MLAEYLHHQLAFRLIGLVLKLDLAAFDSGLATSDIRSWALEDRLESPVV